MPAGIVYRHVICLSPVISGKSRFRRISQNVFCLWRWHRELEGRRDCINSLPFLFLFGLLGTKPRALCMLTITAWLLSYVLACCLQSFFGVLLSPTGYYYVWLSAIRLLESFHSLPLTMSPTLFPPVILSVTSGLSSFHTSPHFYDKFLVPPN